LAPPHTRIHSVPRGEGAYQERLQKGDGYEALIKDLAAAAGKHKKKVLAIVVPFSRAGDVAFIAYKHNLSGGSPKIAVCSIEVSVRYHTVAKARVKVHAFQDFNDERLKIPGHTPVPSLFSGGASSPLEETVAGLKRNFKYALVVQVPVSVADPLRVPQVPVSGAAAGAAATPKMEYVVKIPRMDQLPFEIAQDSDWRKPYDDLVTRYGTVEVDAVMTEATEATPSPPRPPDEEYVNKDQALAHWDIVKSVPLPNYMLHAVVPKGSPADLSSLRLTDIELFLENPSMIARLEIPKGGFVARCGPGTFVTPDQRPNAGEKPAFPYSLLTLGYKGDPSSKPALPEKDCMCLFSQGGGEDCSVQSVHDALVHSGMLHDGEIWAHRRPQPQKGPRKLSSQGMVFLPDELAVANLTMPTIGCLTPFMMKNFSILYEISKQGAKVAPQQGANVAVLIARKKVIVPCLRVLRLKEQQGQAE